MVERSSLKSHPAEGDKRSSYRSLKLGHSGKTKDTRTPTSVVLDVIFQDLTVFGVATPSNTQETVLSVLEVALRRLTGTSIKPENRTILHNLQGRVRSGELLAVIGRPGSGCSTFLKTIAGELNGLVVDPKASISYGGITQSRFKRFFNGEANYSPELDIHFPHLTVQQTLNFAAALRAPHNRLAHQTREQYVKQVVGKAIDTYGLSHVVETQVGNDFIRGVSGGERKRVSIAEMVVSGCSVSCWDQSTRGLDSTTALNFVKSLREDARNGSCHIASLYQTSDAILLQFDRVLVLYEGRQIYYGSILRASKYFEDMGWLKPKNQPLGDFLAGLTNPEERQAREGYRDCVPRTAEEFEKAWVKSQRSSRLRQSLGWYNTDLNREGLLPDTERVLALKNSRAFTHTSSYLASQSTQIRYCVTRMAWRLWNDKKSTLIVTWGQTVMSLILGSLFYQTPNNTNGLYSKGGVLFASILLNIIVTIVEIFQLLGNKSIIERQSSYVLYRPWTEAFAGIILNIPLKLITASIFNIILYFLSGLHRTPESFFIFFLFVYTVTLVMSSVFRTIGAVATALPQAFALVGIVLPMFVVYTGFVVPKPYMHVWFKWLTYINPVGYAFESLIANEFHGRDFNCTAERIVPPYAEIANGSFVCAIRGSVPNQQFVSGDAYISANYNFFYSHIWRNLGILLAFLIFFIILCLIINERNAVLPVSTESLIFRKKRLQRSVENPNVKTQFSSSSSSNFLATEVSPELGLTHTKTLSWSYLCYDIQINKETKRLLNDISGWVKPGTLTALMGASGAGKTTLLNALAKQLSTGVVTGDILLDGQSLPLGFERNCGYVRQQDLHVETTTVREALQFSALLRQPRNVSKEEKFHFVENIINALNMYDFADAVVGVPGRGLNTRQRKLLSIGVELAAKPSVLLFLDEPTTGLDSQSAYSVITFLRLLANAGMSILCTIHQPSAVIFQQFDRLLLLTKGGRTAYFGDIGKDSQTLIQYLERNGARKYNSKENPAEYMIEVTSESSDDWPNIWQFSTETEKCTEQLNHLKLQEASEEVKPLDNSEGAEYREYALPFYQQLYYVSFRVFQQYWRSPEYIWAKILLACVSSLFIGFTFFQADSSIQGIQNVFFAIFMQAVIYPPLVNQIIPKFVTNRELYEVRERLSKTYCWQAFLLAQVLAEIPYQILMGIIVFIIWNYTVLGIQTSERQGLILLYIIQFFLWAGTVAQMVISALPSSEVAGMLCIVMFVLSLVFSGVLQSPSNMPHFWKFLWRVSPLSHWIAGIASTGLHGRSVICAAEELSTFNPPASSTCQEYLNQFLNNDHGLGYLLNPDAVINCQYCPFKEADQILAQSGIYWSNRWSNLGYGMIYIGFNVVMTVFLYYAFRIGKMKRSAASLGQKPLDK